MYNCCCPHEQRPNPFTSPHLYSCLIQMNHILQHNFCLRMKCYTFSVLCLSLLHLSPSGLFPHPSLSSLGSLINMTRSSFKSCFFCSHCLLTPSEQRAFVYLFIIFSFLSEIIYVTHCILCAPKLTVRIHQQSVLTCDSMFVWYIMFSHVRLISQ